jgi:hypothetical protein
MAADLAIQDQAAGVVPDLGQRNPVCLVTAVLPTPIYREAGQQGNGRLAATRRVSLPLMWKVITAAAAAAAAAGAAWAVQRRKGGVGQDPAPPPQPREYSGGGGAIIPDARGIDIDHPDPHRTGPDAVWP